MFCKEESQVLGHIKIHDLTSMLQKKEEFLRQYTEVIQWMQQNPEILKKWSEDDIQGLIQKNTLIEEYVYRNHALLNNIYQTSQRLMNRIKGWIQDGPQLYGSKGSMKKGCSSPPLKLIEKM
jgi:hypothetical protein